MKRHVRLWLLVGLLGYALGSDAQLVRRKDYDAAFAIQAGGETGILTRWQHPRLAVTPAAGLKMTFPFTRKWFLGSEVNYSRLKYGFARKGREVPAECGNELRVRADMETVSVPVYLKYMLNCNRASILFGLYGSYRLAAKWEPAEEEAPPFTAWNAGVTAGYEYRLVKRLNLQFRVNAGVREVAEKHPYGGRLLPVQACLTLSYDFLRIGDCGCD